MEALKRVYQAAGDSECCAALGQMIEGLDPIDDIDDLQDWVRDSDNLAARVIRLAQGQRPHRFGGADTRAVAGQCRSARHRLRGPGLGALRSPRPGGQPAGSGPAGHGPGPTGPGVKDQRGQHGGEPPAGPVAGCAGDLRRGQVCPRSGAYALPGPGRCRPAVEWVAPSPPAGRYFTGWFWTGDTVADWRVLAPTDWHFSPRGPVASRLTAMAGQTRERVAILVTSYDPCAPWALHSATGGD